MRKGLSALILAPIALSAALVLTPSKPIAAERGTVEITNFKFDPKIVTVKAGTTVKWVNKEGRHTIESDTGAFKSDVLSAGAEFSFKFDNPGTYAYHCGFHGDKGGKDMAGKIVVTR